jgi:hypothetical protein
MIATTTFDAPSGYKRGCPCRLAINLHGVLSSAQPLLPTSRWGPLKQSLRTASRIQLLSVSHIPAQIPRALTTLLTPTEKVYPLVTHLRQVGSMEEAKVIRFFTRQAVGLHSRYEEPRKAEPRSPTPRSTAVLFA